MSRKRIGSTLSWHSRSWTHGTTIRGGLRDLEGPWELRESPPLPRPLSFLPPSPAPSSAFPIKVCILIVVVLIFKCLRQVLMAVVLDPPLASCLLLLSIITDCTFCTDSPDDGREMQQSVHRMHMTKALFFLFSFHSRTHADSIHHAMLVRLCPVIKFLLDLILFPLKSQGEYCMLLQIRQVNLGSHSGYRDSCYCETS